MNNLILLTNELIPVYKNDEGKKLVNARELHEWLESGQDFSTWIKNRIDVYGFIENKDFTSFHNIVEREIGATRRIEYIVTLDMAKELSMVEKTDKGKQARQYFIKCEEKLKEVTTDISKLSPELQMFKTIFDKVAQQELEQKQIVQAVQETQQEVQAIREVVEIRPSNSWRGETNRLMTKICFKLKDYKKPKEEAYKALEERAGCDLKIRLKNMKARQALQGVSKSKIDELNYLDVIAEDKKLIEIYTAIVKEMAIKYKVA